MMKKLSLRSVVPFALVAVILVGCQTKPTRIVENPERLMKTAGAEPEPVVITEKTVVLDARPAFENSLAHIPRAISVQWTDFTQSEQNTRGVLLSDRFELAKRLARVGVAPDSEVVVVGNGVNGKGEEGRLAWTLAYLGIQDVRAIPMSYFTGALTNVQSSPPQPIALWQPQTQEKLLATRAEVLFVINNHGMHTPVEFVKGKGAKLYRILDVRSAREYLNKEGIGLEIPIPNMEALNTPWTDYFNIAGRPEVSVVERLREVGVTPDQRLIVLDDRGLRSAAVTMALYELGFKDVANYAGGLQELISQKMNSTPAKRKSKKRR